MRGARVAAAGGAVRLRAQRGALADGGGAAQQMFGRAIYVGSAGVRKGELDPFAVAVMDEIGLDISRHRPITFEELEDREGLNFDLIVTLSPEAHHRALELTRTMAVEVEYWPTADPTAVEGSREQRLDAYRDGARPADGSASGSASPAAAAMNDQRQRRRRAAICAAIAGCEARDIR